MQDRQGLPLEEDEGLSCFEFHQVLVELRNQLAQIVHEIGQRRCHVTDEGGCCGVDHVGEDI